MSGSYVAFEEAAPRMGLTALELKAAIVSGGINVFVTVANWRVLAFEQRFLRPPQIPDALGGTHPEEFGVRHVKLAKRHVRGLHDVVVTYRNGKEVHSKMEAALGWQRLDRDGATAVASATENKAVRVSVLHSIEDDGTSRMLRPSRYDAKRKLIVPAKRTVKLGDLWLSSADIEAFRKAKTETQNAKREEAVSKAMTTHHDAKRSEIVGAAFAVLALRPGKTRNDKGAVVITKVVDEVLRNADKFWPSLAKPPLAPETLAKWLGDYIARLK